MDYGPGGYIVSAGAALVVLGLLSYFLTGFQSLTALSPTLFGIMFLLIGFLSGNKEWYRTALQATAVLSFFVFIGSLRALTMISQLSTGNPVVWASFISQAMMGLIAFALLAGSVNWLKEV